MDYLNTFIFKAQKVNSDEYIIGRIGLPHIVESGINKPNKEIETEMWVYENNNRRKPWKKYYVKTETITLIQ